MAIWALLDEKGELVLGEDQDGTWKDTVFVSNEQQEMQALHDKMPHGRAKRLRLTELVPKQTVRG